MIGRIAVFLVGSIAIMTMKQNASMNTNDAIGNLAQNYSRSQAYDIALSGANMAGNTLYFSKTFRGMLKDNVNFNGGKLSVSVQSVGGNIQVTSSGTYPATGSQQEKQSVVYYLTPAFMDRFVVLTDNDPGTIPWTTYDTANGNLHSNNTLKMDHYSGSAIMPVFNGKVTATRGFLITSATNPVFAQIPETGVSVAFPTSFTPVTEPPFLPGGVDWNSTYTITSGPVVSMKQLHLQFFVQSGVQKIRYFRFDTRSTNNGYGDFRSTDTVVNAPASGILYAPGVDVFVEGTVKDKISIVTIPNGAGLGGNMFVTNDLRCSTDPRLYPSSSDYIGLLAYNNIIIANTMNDNATNNGSNRFRIEASLFALMGGLAAADNATRTRQVLDIYGSITQKDRKGVGSGSNPIGSSSGGFMKGYYYDARLMDNHALLMPAAPLMALDSWLVKGTYN